MSDPVHNPYATGVPTSQRRERPENRREGLHSSNPHVYADTARAQWHEADGVSPYEQISEEHVSSGHTQPVSLGHLPHAEPSVPSMPIGRQDGRRPSIPHLQFPESPSGASPYTAGYVPPRPHAVPYDDPFGEIDTSYNSVAIGHGNRSQDHLAASGNGFTEYERPSGESLDGRLTPIPGHFDSWKPGDFGDENELLGHSGSYGSSTFIGADVEAQAENRNRRMNVFGMPLPLGDPYANEYADDEYAHMQIPIHGDQYALNTWEDPNDDGGYEDRDLGASYEAGAGAEGIDAEEEERAIQAKRIKLYRGNLVLDCPVSEKLLAQYPEHQPVREFTHMRYSAATTDPSEFVQSDFTLRQMCYQQPRSTELCIAVTIYNEDDILLARTLQGVFNNIRHLCNRTRSKIWGTEAWKKVVVVVIADGRTKLNPRAKALMAALGVYQEGFAKNMVNEKPVEAHIYEYTTMVRVAKVTDTVKLTADKATPVQMIFCLKEKNKKKINSHRWLFQALCPILRPKVCVLLDAGTRPGNHSIYHLWKSFDKNPHCGGACGEIAAMLGSGYSKLFNPLVAAQNFEYKMSNILDKPSESVFGFITVLPGAFSAYRYEALLNDASGVGPLEKYFKGEKLEADGGIFSSNMYLAEDRVLCWELVAKRNSRWLLKYVKSAKAHTDVPDRLAELVLQRRRWLNGSFFASIYAQAHMYQIWRSSHSIARKLALHIEFLYQTVTLIFSWFSLGNFFLVFKILTAALGDPSLGFAPGKVLSVVLTWIYGACVVATFILSFGNRPQGTKWFYNMIVAFFACLMAYIIFAAIFIAVKSIQSTICLNGGFEPKLLVKDKTFRDLLISLLATYALYVISSVMFLEPWHLFTSFGQYLLLSPAYINVFNVYAFSNTHDISWGTKGDTAVKTDLGVVKADDSGKVEVELPTSSDLVDSHYMDEINILSAPALTVKAAPNPEQQRSDYYALFRSTVVLVWLFMNVALIAVVLNVGGLEKFIPTTGTGSGSGTTAGAGTAGGTGTSSNPVRRAALDAIHLSLRAAGDCHVIETATTRTTEIYLAVVLWAVAGIAAYRFVFSAMYMVKYIFRG